MLDNIFCRNAAPHARPLRLLETNPLARRSRKDRNGQKSQAFWWYDGPGPAMRETSGESIQMVPRAHELVIMTTRRQGPESKQYQNKRNQHKKSRVCNNTLHGPIMVMICASLLPWRGIGTTSHNRKTISRQVLVPPMWLCRYLSVWVRLRVLSCIQGLVCLSGAKLEVLQWNCDASALDRLSLGLGNAPARWRPPNFCNERDYTWQAMTKSDKVKSRHLGFAPQNALFVAWQLHPDASADMIDDLTASNCLKNNAVSTFLSKMWTLQAAENRGPNALLDMYRMMPSALHDTPGPWKSQRNVWAGRALRGIGFGA